MLIHKILSMQIQFLKFGIKVSTSSTYVNKAMRHYIVLSLKHFADDGLFSGETYMNCVACSTATRHIILPI